MPIKDRNLKPGTKLVARYHKQTYTCQVVAGESGKLRFRLEDGREFKSPSGAGITITGHACDGWVFWSVETATDAPAVESQHTEEMQEQATEAQVTKDAPATVQTEAANESAPAKKIFRLPNQKGAPAGQVRWHCHDCAKSFLMPAGEIPHTCPQGHKA